MTAFADVAPLPWYRVRIKHVSTLKGRLGWQGLTADEYRDDGPYVVSSAHFGQDGIEWELCPRVSAERYLLDANIQLRVGDVLLMKDGAAMGKLAFVDHLPGPACLNSHLLLFRPRRGAYVPRYMFYLLGTPFFQDFISVNGTGATFLGISQSAVGNYRFALPPTETQQVIADFLDRRTAAIDELIAKKERLIELLQEKRQALITHAVTKGLDPNVPMKDSGIEWLEQIPTHWSCAKAGHLCSLISKGTTPAEMTSSPTDNCVPFLRVQNLTFFGSLDETDLVFVSRDIHERQLSRSVVYSGDVLINIVGPPLGQVSVVSHSFPEWNLNQAIAFFRVCGAEARFVSYWLLSRFAREWFLKRAKKTSGQANITLELCRTIPVLIPPKDEQRAICDWLDQKAERLDCVARLVAQQIESLREYRQALITEAVTGKLEISKAEAAA